MNQSHNDYTDRHGHTYRYDPDYDCYYRVFSPEEYAELSHWSKYGWLWTAAGLTVFAAIVTYFK